MGKMTSWNVIEWIVFVFAVLWAAMNHNTLIQYYKTNSRSEAFPNSMALCQIIGVVSDIIFQYSPLHLIWLFLLSYVFPFFVIRVPFLAKIAWLYGYSIAWLSRL